MIAKRDLENEFSIEEVEDELVKYSTSFYGARLDFDKYAVKKCYFIATYVSEIIKGSINIKEINNLCDEIEEENRMKL